LITKGQFYGNDLAYYFDPVAFGCYPRLALQ
jgi:hypothetical protein